MKRIASIFLVLLLLALSGCSGGKSPELTEQQKTDYDTQVSIKEQLENTPIPKGYSALLADGDFAIVLCNDGTATITIRVAMPYTIPYVAEFFLPVAQEEAEAAGVTLERFSVISSNENKNGTAQDAFAEWHTSDGEKGPLSDRTSGEAVVKPNLTIEQVYKYYSDYKSIVSDMIVSRGGETLLELNCETVLTVLKDGGMPIAYYIVYTSENDPNILQYGADTELEYVQKAGFVDERIESDYDEMEPQSGTIETFFTCKEAEDRAVSLQSSSADIYSYRILVDNVLIRLSERYTLEQAEDISEMLGGEIHSIGGDLFVDNTVGQTTYWINAETKKFHKPSCSYIQGGRTTTESRSTLISKGYSPCGHCNP